MSIVFEKMRPAKWANPKEVEANLSVFEISKDHFCWGCPYGTAMPDRFMCPFITGSCAKYPWTLLEPDEEFMEKVIKIHALKRR